MNSPHGLRAAAQRAASRQHPGSLMARPEADGDREDCDKLITRSHTKRLKHCAGNSSPQSPSEVRGSVSVDVGHRSRRAAFWRPGPLCRDKNT